MILRQLSQLLSYRSLLQFAGRQNRLQKAKTQASQSLRQLRWQMPDLLRLSMTLASQMSFQQQLCS